MRGAAKERLRRFAESETAAVAMEYGLILGTMSLMLLVGLGTINNSLFKVFASIASAVHG